ncbi:hypothetical protein [Bacillus horti]|uniref:Uncharacterized protein n=1 Tax=Caldalkalibacillus horti TaxID=77523 RepID=A0ABT9W4Y7_9BACI|nr:hypothetical protein [Bacillus horti]MDQ0168137.1 hypothetical protein [Bacillus horti]
MSNLHFIIEKLEEKNNMLCLCYFKPDVYNSLQEVEEWQPEKRLLMDSDKKQLVYIIDTPSGWEYIRFPIELWKTVDQALVKEQDFLLVTSVTESGEAHKSFILKDFRKEAVDLILNMRNNANYGEDMSELVEEHFEQVLNNHT